MDRLRMIYEEALKFLYEIKPEKLTEEQLEGYFSVQDNFKTKNKILERLFGSLQNYQSMPNVIGFYTKKERKKKFDKILCGYDDTKILEKYKNYDDLLGAFVREFDIDESTLKRKNNLWVRYSKAIISASRFMSQFKDAKDFDYFVRLFSYNESTAAALPMLLSKEIYGMGFALGCDFLKEIGYDQYPKPDVHLIKIFSRLGLSKNEQFDCYKMIIKMAKSAKSVDKNVTPFKVDKIFWLIGSGRFSDDLQVGRKGDEFIKYIKRHDL